MSSEPQYIDCQTHGPRQVAAIVCAHLLDCETVRGFVVNSDEPTDQQAWCEGCEARFLEEDGMTESFRAFNDAKVVCVACYDGLKSFHSAG